MKHRPIAEVCKINPPLTSYPADDKEVSFIPMSAVTEDGQIAKMQFKRYSEVKTGYTVFEENDVLFAKITPCMENGKGAIAKNLKNGIGAGSTEFHVLRPFKDVSSNWIFRLTSSKQFRKVAAKNMTGSAGQKRVPSSFFTRINIPIPDLNTQNRISSILDKCESARAKRREAIRLTDEFLKSTFLEMFGDPIKNPKGWETYKGGEMFSLSSGKFNPSKNLDDSFPYPSYGGNGIMGYSENYLVNFDTIVVGRVGVYCGCVHRTSGKIWITDNAIFIKEFKRAIDLDFLYYLLNFCSLNRFADYSGQPKITQRPLENIDVIFPPIDLQKKFADIVQKVERLKEKQRESEKELDNLFGSLMQRAFKGELAIK